MPTAPNIHVRKCPGATEVWLKQEWLLANLDGLTEAYLRARCRPAYKKSVQASRHTSTGFMPHSGAAWRYGKKDGHWYYEYDSIPEKAPAMYAQRLPKRAELIAMAGAATGEAAQPLHDILELAMLRNAVAYKKHYLHCLPHQQARLTRAAAAATALAAWLGPEPDRAMLAEACATLAGLDISYLPQTAYALKAKLAPLHNGATVAEVISLPRAGNGNAKSETCSDPQVLAWMMEMKANGNNYPDSYICRKVQAMCALAEKQAPSKRWMKAWLNDHRQKYLAADERFGTGTRLASRDHIPFKPAEHAGDCWQMDGTRVNLVDFKMGDNRRSLYIVAIRDVATGDLIGYAFDISENRWVVQEAMQMAVEATGYLPYQFSYDRFPGHNTEEMKAILGEMENRGTKLYCTHKATGKSNIERCFGTIQQVIMPDSTKYYGEGVKSRNRAAHRSKERLAEIKKQAAAEGWDYEAAVEEATAIIERYRATPLEEYSEKYWNVAKSPRQLHEEADKANVVHVKPHHRHYIFGMKTVRQLQGSLLSITVNKAQYNYRITDTRVVAEHAKVLVVYRPDDLTSVDIYADTQEAMKPHLGTYKECTVQAYGPNAQWGEINRQQAVIADMQADRERRLQMLLAAGAEHYNEADLLMGGMLPKAVAEAAESAYMNDAEDISTNIRNQY